MVAESQSDRTLVYGDDMSGTKIVH
jgi:hypothetical protein